MIVVKLLLFFLLLLLLLLLSPISDLTPILFSVKTLRKFHPGLEIRREFHPGLEIFEGVLSKLLGTIWIHEVDD